MTGIQRALLNTEHQALLLNVFAHCSLESLSSLGAATAEGEGTDGTLEKPQ